MITSKENPLVKETRRLNDSKVRRETGLFIAEGPHLVRELYASNYSIRQLLIDGESITGEMAGLAQIARERNISVAELSSSLMRSISDTEAPQGIAAIVERGLLSKLPPVPSGQPFQALIIDRVQDPGNLGTLLRTAWGFGVDLCVLTPGTADVMNGKAIRSSMGGIFHLPIVYEEPKSVIEWADQNELALFAGDAKAEMSIVEAEFPERLGLIVGNEGAGLSPVWNESKQVSLIGIPMPGRAESLNVAVAAAIMLYEVNRLKNLEMDDWL